ncbi:MAG: glycosyltransferase [Nitrososphaerota archaeon]|nr:glycosyltransferase [Nitrososphaerota archaeon]
MTTENAIPIRVLFLVSALGIGGSQHVMIEILKHLNRSLFDIHIALLEDKGDFRDRVPQDVPVHVLGVRKARMAVLPVTYLCWKIRPKVIISFAAQLNTAVILAQLFMPREIRILTREGANITLPMVASPLRRAIYRAVYAHADLVICQSDDMVERLRARFKIPKNKLMRIYNPVDAVGLRELAQGPSPYDDIGPNLVAVSRFVPVKGVDLLIEAMPAVLRAQPNAILTLVGGGPQESYLRSLAQTIGVAHAIRFSGFQANPHSFIYNANLAVIPSRSEAFSNVALEALALGTSVVATDCPGGMREIALHTDRLTLTERIDPISLASAINSALANRRAWEVKREVDQRFLREFSRERIIALYERTIIDAAGREHERNAT